MCKMSPLKRNMSIFGSAGEGTGNRREGRGRGERGGGAQTIEASKVGQGLS